MAEKDKGRSTTDLVPIVAIINEPPSMPGSGSIGIKRDGSFVLLIKVDPVDFDMRTRPEQESILWVFADMLDSLSVDFPIQIMCHNKRLDIEAFTRQFDARLRDRELPPIMRELITDYVDNYRRQIEINTMVDKEFYVVIPFKYRSKPILDAPSEQIPLGQFFRLITENTQRKNVQDPDPEDLELVRDEMNTRATQIEFFLARMGCGHHRLDTDQMRRLFYEFFHPGLAERQKLHTGAGRGIQVVGGAGDLDNLRRRRAQDGAKSLNMPATQPIMGQTRPALPPKREEEGDAPAAY